MSDQQFLMKRSCRFNVHFSWDLTSPLTNLIVKTIFATLTPESQNFLDPGLAKPQSKLNIGF